MYFEKTPSVRAITLTNFPRRKTKLYNRLKFDEARQSKPVWAKPLTRLPCLVVTSKFNFCILLKEKYAVSFCWLPPVLTSNIDGDLIRQLMSAKG